MVTEEKHSLQAGAVLDHSITYAWGTFPGYHSSLLPSLTLVPTSFHTPPLWSQNPGKQGPCFTSLKYSEWCFVLFCLIPGVTAGNGSKVLANIVSSLHKSLISGDKYCQMWRMIQPLLHTVCLKYTQKVKAVKYMINNWKQLKMSLLPSIKELLPLFL